MIHGFHDVKVLQDSSSKLNFEFDLTLGQMLKGMEVLTGLNS